MKFDSRPKRVLVVAYLFPPVGGAGVQRVAKFVKYLPKHGWLPSVLTVSNPSVPLMDQSLHNDLPEDVILRHAKTFEPGYALKKSIAAGSESPNGSSGNSRRWLKGLARGAGNMVLQPDPQILWWPDALREGTRLLDEINHDAIFVTAPPFSSFLVGTGLKRRTGLPLVLDYRDEWGISNAYWENKQNVPFSRRLQARMQRHVVRCADRLIATTRSSANSLARVVNDAGSAAKVTHIYNGYDADDFRTPPSNEKRHGRRFRLAYVGTLWNLTSVEPLVKGVQLLTAESPELAGRLELVFAGRRTAPQEALLSALDSLPCSVVRQPYLDHGAAVDLMRSADGLCLLLSDVPHAGRVVPAKVFEYMAAQKPIISIAPRGEVSELLRRCPAAHVCTPENPLEISKTLAQEIERHQHGTPATFAGWDVTAFERRTLTGQLTDLLNSLSGTQSPELSDQLAVV